MHNQYVKRVYYYLLKLVMVTKKYTNYSNPIITYYIYQCK